MGQPVPADTIVPATGSTISGTVTDVVPNQSKFRRLLSFCASVFLSRRFFVFTLSCSLASWALMGTHDKTTKQFTSILPPDQYEQLLIWMAMLFFATSLAKKTIDPADEFTSQDRKEAQKFITVIVLFGFTFFALWTKVLPPDTYTSIHIWLSGLYFGVDIAQIWAFRRIGRGESANPFIGLLGGNAAPVTSQTATTITQTTTTGPVAPAATASIPDPNPQMTLPITPIPMDPNNPGIPQPNR